MKISTDFINKILEKGMEGNKLSYSVFKTSEEYYLIPIEGNYHTQVEFKIKGPCVLEWQRVYMEDGHPLGENILNQYISSEATVDLCEKVFNIE
jgi:hypothetical protein